MLNAFDTYYLSRQIPVPVPLPPTPTLTSTTVTVGDTSQTFTPVPPTLALEIRTFGFRFEHDAPSNFWGKGCFNKGRVNAKNPYEAKLVRPNQIAFGGSLSVNGQLNYLQYFSEDNKHDFDVPNTGGIAAVYPKQGILAIINQFNNFSVGYDDNLLRIDGNGNVITPSGTNLFGRPNVQVNGNYGCQLFDKNTIRERDGLIHFLDSSKTAILQHNFQTCRDISSNKTDPNRQSTILSWLAKKIISVAEFNQATDNPNKRFFHSVINPANNEYIISDFALTSKIYINEERDYAIDKQETMAYDIKADVWKGAYSFTPQYYGYLESELTGNQLFSFKDAIPYNHYTTEQTTFNTFYGVKCGRVYKFVVRGESGYFVDQVITETGQLSRIFKAYFKQGEFMFSAPFLRDLNTLSDPNIPLDTGINKLVDGNPLYGTWIEVRMIGYPEMDDIYSQLDGIQCFFIGESNTGIR